MEKDFIASRISQLRVERDVSEYQMSAELGKSPGYVQAITSGRTMPSVEQLFNIIDYFEMTPAEFFDPANQDSAVHRKAIHLLRSLSSDTVQTVVPLLQCLEELERTETAEEDPNS